MVCLYRPWGLFAAVMDGSALQPSGAGRKGTCILVCCQQQPATARLEIKKNLPANANENRAGILCRVDVFS